MYIYIYLYNLIYMYVWIVPFYHVSVLHVDPSPLAYPLSCAACLDLAKITTWPLASIPRQWCLH